MHSSNSLYFTRNSQLIKAAQSSTPYYIDLYGRPSQTPVIQRSTTGNLEFYYTSDGGMYDANTKDRYDTRSEYAKRAQDYAKNHPQEFTNGVPNFGQQKQQGRAPGQSYEKELYYINERRKSLGLKEYASRTEMMRGEAKLKQEYNAALRNHVASGGTQEEFINRFPDPTEYEAEVQKEYRLNPGQRVSFSDKEIETAIISHDVDKLEEISPQEVIRVLNNFIAQNLPKYSPIYKSKQGNTIGKHLSIEDYLQELRTTVLPAYLFKDPRAIDYIIGQKRNEATQIEARVRGTGFVSAEQQRRALGRQVSR